jgi:oligosaccharide:H+ symporter
MSDLTEKANGYIKPRLQFIIVEAFFWCALSVTMFNVVYLNELKVSSTIIGMILGSNALISIFAQPIWGWISDKIGSSKKVLMLCICVSSLCYLLLFFIGSVSFIAAILMVDTFFRCAAGTLLDIWIVSKVSRENKIGYGSIRLWGSIGFAVMMVVYGRIVNTNTVRIIYPLYTLFMLLTLFFCARMDGNNLPASPAGSSPFKAGSLFKNYSYTAFVLFIFLLNIPTGPFSSFLPKLIESVGGTKAQFGLMQSVKALAEVPFFLFGKRLLDRYGPVKLMVFSTVVSLVQAVAYATSKSVLQVSLALLLSGPSYSLFAIGMLHYVYCLAPDGMKTVAQMLAGTVSMSISSMIGNPAGGMLIDRLQLRNLYWVGALFIAISLLLFTLSIVFRKRYENKLEERCVT